MAGGARLSRRPTMFPDGTNIAGAWTSYASGGWFNMTSPIGFQIVIHKFSLPWQGTIYIDNVHL